MARVLLDTTVLIDIMRDRSVVARLLDMRDRGDEAWTSPLNVEELWRGLRDRERPAALRLVGGLFIARLGVAEAMRAGDWRRDFARRGTTLAQADVLIAAAAVGVDALLATGNPKHFPMKGLRVEHWPVGE